jgi:alpha-1,3-rhamnosyl/mannosyltransferase
MRRRHAGGWRVYHSPFYVFPYLSPLPAVVTLYDATPLLARSGLWAAGRALYAGAHRLAARRARRLITLTAAARDELVGRLGLPASKFAVIPPGRPATPSLPAATSIEGPFLLYVGINKPHKNLPALVRAYAGLDHDAPPLLVAGPIDPRFGEAQQAAEQAELAGRVRFIGRVPDDRLAQLYSQATLLVVPSLAEGFGFPVLEGMTAGTPVACSNLPVLREVAGDAALYFDPGQTDSIREAIAEALRRPDLRAHLRARGLEQAGKFSWERAARETVGVYEEVVERSGG